MLWYAGLLAAHLLLYLLLLRHRPAFRRETTMFAYHAVSAGAVSVAAIIDAVLGLSGIEANGVVAVIAMHGIYSVSFLEVWSLSEGGYSLQIMEHVARAEERREPVDLGALRAIGEAKQGNRLEGLASIGLVRLSDRDVELTAAGRAVATVFAGLAWLTHVKDGL